MTERHRRDLSISRLCRWQEEKRNDWNPLVFFIFFLFYFFAHSINISLWTPRCTTWRLFSSLASRKNHSHSSQPSPYFYLLLFPSNRNFFFFFFFSILFLLLPSKYPNSKTSIKISGKRDFFCISSSSYFSLKSTRFLLAVCTH